MSIQQIKTLLDEIETDLLKHKNIIEQELSAAQPVPPAKLIAQEKCIRDTHVLLNETKDAVYYLYLSLFTLQKNFNAIIGMSIDKNVE
jgi:hypothetical protein